MAGRWIFAEDESVENGPIGPYAYIASAACPAGASAVPVSMHLADGQRGEDFSWEIIHSEDSSRACRCATCSAPHHHPEQLAIL